MCKYFIIFVSFVPFLGCEEFFRSSATDPKAYPYELTIDFTRELKSANIDRQYKVHDIDGDGESEIIHIDNIREPNGQLHNLTVTTLNQKTVDEVNFPESVNIHFMDGQTFFDIDHDGMAEVILSLKRNDSLFAIVANIWDNSRREIFLANRPDVIPYPHWDCGVSGGMFLDINNDGKKDLVCYLYAQRSLNPRGLFAYDIQSGKKLWACRFGAVPSGLISIEDINDDGEEEILVPTFAPGNGAVANGIDDYHSYVLAISKAGAVLWATQLGGEGTQSTAETYTTQDAKHRIVVVSRTTNPRLDSSYVALVDGSSGKIMKTWYKANEMFCLSSSHFVEKMNGGTDIRIFLTSMYGTIYVLNSNLDIIQQIQLPAGTTNNDGFELFDDSAPNHLPFIGRITMANNQTYLLDRDLNIIAVTDRPIGSLQLIRRRGVDTLLLALTIGNQWSIGNLKAQPFYLFFRYKFFVSLIVLALGYASVWATRRFNFYYWLYVQLLRRSESEGIIVINNHGKVVHVSRTATSILALERLSMKEHHWQRLLATPQYFELTNFIERKLQSTEGERKECTLNLGDKTRHVVCSVSPIRNLFKRNLGWLVLLVDVTKTIEHDRVLNWAAVARNLAHEMKTPLGVILLNSESVREQLTSNTEVPAAFFISKMETVKEEVNRLNEYVKNFMKVANLQPPNLLPNDLNGVLSDVLLYYQRRKPESIVLRRELSDHLPAVLLDVNLFTAAIINLLDNAVKAMDGKGILTIRTSLARELKNYQDDVVELMIEDTGCGISARDASKIFQPFFTRTGSGTGLGLAITKKVVEDHGGSITFASEVGKGTRFLVRMPGHSDRNGAIDERKNSHS